jgi:type I restriction enzyme S subunit
MDEISNHHYTLTFTDTVTKMESNNNNIPTKTLGSVCTFMPKSKRAAAYGKETGTYPFFTSSLTVSKFVDEPDYKEECLIIGTGGNANIKYASSFSCSADNVIIKLNDVEKVNVNIQYIYKYLLYNIEILANGFIGLGIKHVSKDFIKNISIPIPTLEVQQEIINKIDSVNSLIDHLENEFDKVKEDYNKNLKTIFQFDNQINEGKQEENEKEED